MENTFGMDIIPENEEQRIEALKRYKILDTTPENAFDNVAKLAAQIFEVPVALISLVDTNRVFFKANIGMGNVKNTPRGISLCSLAILNPEVTVFEDATIEPCLLANPLVAGEFGLKFYAGAPLITHDGLAIGTLCIVDKKIRSFTANDTEILKGLANIVMDEIRLRAAAIEESEKQKIAQELLIESEYKARYMISDAPVAIGILTGRELIIETANNKILEIWGKTNEIIGMPLKQGLPELEGQPFLQILDDVFTNGIPFYGNEAKATLNRSEVLQDGFFNYVYHPIKNSAGDSISIMVVATEVTDQVKARKSVEINAHRLNSMVMSAPIGMTIMKGRDFVVEIANKPMFEIWQRTADQVIGKKIMDVFPELVDQPFPALLASVFDTGQPVSIPEIEVEVSTAEGLKHYYVDFQYAPLFDTNGDVEAIMATVNNITDTVIARKLLEESEEELQSLNEELTATVEELAAANEEMLTTNEELAETHDNLQNTMTRLAQSESRFRDMIEQAPVAMLVLRGEGMVFEIVNPYMLKLLDRGPEIVGQPMLRGMPEMAGQPVFDIIYEVYRTGKPYYGFESPVIITRDGKTETGYFNYVYTPLLENGKIRGILQVATEVTDQIRFREELQKAEEMLRFSIEAANVGTWFIDIQTLEFTPSSSMKKLFGYLPEEDMSYDAILGQVTSDYRGKIIAAVNATFTRGESFNLEFSVTGLRDQKTHWIRVIGKLDNDPEGKLIHFSGVAIDITEQKQDEIRKNDFIAMVSHELKTPLTSLKGYMQLLTAKNRKNEDGFTFSALEKGNAQITKMTAMINGFLNVSQLEAGKIHLDKQTFPLNDLMDEVVEEISITTQNHQIVISPCPPVSVHGDQEKIGQVINNFLSNAVKYSPRGKNIELSCREIDGWVQVSVKDEGIGINSSDIDKLFDRFYRVDNPNAQNISGFGIGLYLCSEIIQRHDGKIWVESEPGKGSAFYFSLPAIQHL